MAVYQLVISLFKRSTLHQFITNVLKKRWQEQKCEPAQRWEFFVKYWEVGSGKTEEGSFIACFNRSNAHQFL
jgi:hypothetical protein